MFFLFVDGSERERESAWAWELMLDLLYISQISFTSTNGPQMWLNRVLEVQLLSDANGGYVQWSLGVR